MPISDSDHVADKTTDLLHLDTQEFPFGIDLTVAEIHQLTGPGSLDFGGSEFAEAPSELLEPVKRNPDDDYGWWPLEQGTYLIRYNEGVELDEDEIGLVQAHPRLMRAGAHHPSFTVYGEENDLYTLLSVGTSGCNIKENSRVSRLLILGS